MRIEFYKDVHEFVQDIMEFLLNHEAENNLFFSLLNRLQENPHTFGEEDPMLVRVMEYGMIEGVAMRTPPHNIILSYNFNPKAISLLIDKLQEKNIELPGVLGEKSIAKNFYEEYKRNAAINDVEIRNERIYKLIEVDKNCLGLNEFTQADNEHIPLIIEWGVKFIEEAVPENLKYIENFKKRLKGSVNEGKIYLLKVQEEVVSMARYAGDTPNGGLVNLVYTPPSKRQHGYATELVAQLSQHILDMGKEFCFLFTDLKNPTSNSIYQKIGYRAIIDVDQYEFS